MNMGRAICVLGFACADFARLRDGQLTGEFTEDDVKDSLKVALKAMTGQEPSDEDAEEVLEV